MKGRGRRFPNTAQTYACQTGMSRTPIAKGIAPRSSKIGRVPSNITASGSGKLRMKDSIDSRMN